ncbi:centrosomal protein of 152 kDa [Cephus cinctus]|uniref:Centrosomal protein of 152 kDa n=1 Tax=Cephus cinctus TaxID=211228 RepID=A0AAJ7FVM6_CEPCN|nr:centrosomal protein of 152 kDa [Cephus cinctus]XP_015610582.1 centrosomal protein of 152 kDa [Cephus cinctus]
MEGPGLSLFQGSESIQLNTSSRRQEEEEEQEDRKRRDKEIGALLKHALGDLEDDDDVSFINSTHSHVTCNEEHSGIMVNSLHQPSQSDRSPTISQFQKEFDAYGRIDETKNYNQNSNSLHHADSEIGPTVSDIQRDLGVYGQTMTPYGKNNRSNDMDNMVPDTPYELPKPPNPGYPLNLRTQVNEEYTFHDNYPYNYGTPANHYDRQTNNYSNNGYIDGYDEHNKMQLKPVREYGGGDNDVISDHFNHCYKTSPNGRPADENTAYKMAELNSKEQLEVLYSVRIKEIQNLTEQVQQLQLEKDEERNQLNRKLALAQAEVERSNLSRNQAQNSLVDAKAEINDLQSQVASLKENVAILEKTNHNMAEDLAVSKNSVVDLQQKIVILEKVQTLQANDRSHEKFLKQAQEKHAIQMKNMQTQIDVLTEKLNMKETSYIDLEHKLADVRRAHETLMVEKGDTMNRLAQALEESQNQCRNLMASNNGQEVMQLRAQIKIAAQEKEELFKTIKELQHKLELAKSDTVHYDSLLATTLEDESDSIKQMKLGELHNKSKCKPNDDITNKLRGELQRCLAGQAVKRKEINRLENTLAQKEKELDNALKMAETCRTEAARYAKRVTELEQELKLLLTEQAMKASSQIQKLSDHLTETKKQYDLLKQENQSLQQKLEETLAINQESMRKFNEDTTAQQEREAVDEYNKEYLEIHNKAVERVRKEAEIEIMQLSVHLEQTQKELDRVKELYIDVCGTKEQLIANHKHEVETLMETYADLESRKIEMEKVAKDLEVQIKVTERLSREGDNYRSKIIELERDLAEERKKKEDYTKKIHTEIERAKEEALRELRNTHPGRQINVNLPDHCSEHLDKITQLEDDCKRLEEKLSITVEEQRKMSSLQAELDDAKLKIAQMEIGYESLRKKYETVLGERNDLNTKLSKLESELLDAKKCLKMEDSDDAKLKIARIQLENATLRKKHESILSERNAYKEKISKLEIELNDTKNIVKSLENKVRRSNEISLISRSEMDQEISRYKETIAQLTTRMNGMKDDRSSNSIPDEKSNQLQEDLQGQDERMQRLKDFERIKNERDQLVIKLKNQAKQFEQYVKNQKQVSVELNLSPRSSGDGTDFQKLKESTIKEVREEMEQKVAEELRGIEQQHREKQKLIEERYKALLVELQTRYDERTKEMQTMKEAIIAEKVKLHSQFKAQEQIVARMIEAKLDALQKELMARKVRIEQLQDLLKSKENDVEEERNVMAQVMSEWAAEMQEVKTKEVEMSEELKKLKETEESLQTEVKQLKEKEREMKSNIDMLKHKYQSAKKTASNYKEYAENKEKFLLNECKRIEEGYKRAMNTVQQKVDAIVSTQEEQVATKLKELESQYEEQLEQMRLKMKYKTKC